ncbi:MAG: DNRLRE domain-containing protein [Methanosarcinales archaeon]|nr:DNRLRE domain-containing protein [Methanosarcinales archaeon]
MTVLVGVALAGTFSSGLEEDTYLDADSPDDTFAGEDTLWASSAGAEQTRVAFLGFKNNFGNVGLMSPSDVQSATMTLTVTEVESPGEIKAYVFHGATLPTLTWNDQEKYEPEPEVSFEVEETGEIQIDATELVRKAVDICTEGCPFSIVLVAEDDVSVGFASMESSEAQAVLKYTV